MFDPRRLAELAASSAPAALCTVVETQGSTPRKAGASMVVVADGSEHGAIEGTIGGGAVEQEVRRFALEAIRATRPRLFEVALTTQLGMCCGGKMRFYVEPLRMRPPCIILGGGHVGQALCAVATHAGFDVTVADPREEMLTQARLPDAVALVDAYEAEDLPGLPFSPDAFVVIATHDHQVDQQLVERVLPLTWRFVALVGSQRKALMTRERCLQRGLDPELVGALRCPAGLDIGAETPGEIALAIVAEMVQVRRKDDALRHTRGAPTRSATLLGSSGGD